MSSVRVEFMIDTVGPVSAKEIAEAVAVLFDRPGNFAYPKPTFIQGSRGINEIMTENQVSRVLVSEYCEITMEPSDSA